MQGMIKVLLVGTLCGFATQTLAQASDHAPIVESTSQQMRRELEMMKQQLLQMQEKIHRQEELLEKLSAPAPAAPAPVATTPPDKEEQLKREVKEEVLRDLQPRLAAANKTFLSQFNPAIGLIIDIAFTYREPEGEDFVFRSAELDFSTSIDPFLRGYATLTGSPDGVEIEEAAVVTTSLPYNLTVKGGRFFADFGRLAKFHDHDLPFVNRPLVLDRFVDGESQGDGLEVSYLVPIPHYLLLTMGMYDKLGGENERIDNEAPRALARFTYLGRAATFLNLGDAHSIDLGASVAYTPEIALEENGPRYLVGIDFTYRFVPPGQAAYRNLVLGAEVLYNNERRPVGGFPDDPEAAPPEAFRRRQAFGAYAYLEAGLSRRFHPGFLFDYAQDIDRTLAATRAYSPYLTIWLSEFQRLRLQYTYLDDLVERQHQFFLQWTSILGSHAHTFRDR